MKRTYIFLLLSIIIIGVVVAYPHIMISPGNLYEAHSDIKNDCFACHTMGSGTPNEKCISCHKISEISKNNSILKFHETIRSQSCTSCHSDHKGMNEKLVFTPFNHDFIDAKSRNNCVSCHQSPNDNLHNISSTNCLSCHSLDNWKNSTFNHDKYFVLDKNHNVSCTTCHKNNDYKTYTCFGCHEHSINKIREEHEEKGITNFTSLNFTEAVANQMPRPKLENKA